MFDEKWLVNSDYAIVNPVRVLFFYLTLSHGVRPSLVSQISPKILLQYPSHESLNTCMEH